jgi:hypothetical protein
MENTWDILTKELAINGIKLVDTQYCQYLNGEQLVKISIEGMIRKNDKIIKKYKNTFESLWKDIIHLAAINYPTVSIPLDEKMIKLFICSIKGLMNFITCLMHDFYFSTEDLDIKQITMAVQSILDKDYKQFSKEAISILIDYKMAIDFVFRSMCHLSYVNKLLLFSTLDYNKINTVNIKTARGVQGPWANLDLPLLERTWEWGDVEEEMRGRDRDKRRQRRYRDGLESYNQGNVADGFLWREQRNEPYSWYNRNTDSPYPGRSTLMRS